MNRSNKVHPEDSKFQFLHSQSSKSNGNLLLYENQNLISKEHENDGFVQEENQYLDDENFSDVSTQEEEKDEVEQLRADLQKKLKLNEMKMNKEFNDLLQKQESTFNKNMNNQLKTTKRIVGEKMKNLIAREKIETQKLKEFYIQLQQEKKKIEYFRERLVMTKKKYQNIAMKLKKDQFQKKETTTANFNIDLGFGQTDNEMELEEDVLFGSEWFEDDINYDLTEITTLETENHTLTQQEGTKNRRGKTSTAATAHNFIKKLTDNFIVRFFFLKSDLLYVQSKFGSSIGIYFRLFRNLVLFNSLFAVVILLPYIYFLILWFNDSSNSLDLQENIDLLYPKIWENSYIPHFLSFKGFKKNAEFQFHNKIIYFLMVFPGVLGYTVFLFYSILSENKEKMKQQIKKRDTNNKNSLTFILNLYDHRSTTLSDTNNQQYELINEITSLITQRKMEKQIITRKKPEKIKLYLQKLLGWIIFSFFIVFFFSVLFSLGMVHDSINSFFESYGGGFNGTSFLIPISFVILNFISPGIVRGITWFEKYDKKRTKLLVLIYRLFILKYSLVVTLLILFVINGFKVVDSEKYINSCYFSYSGDQISSIILYSFFAELINLIKPIIIYCFNSIYNLIRNKTLKKTEENATGTGNGGNKGGKKRKKKSTFVTYENLITVLNLQLLIWVSIPYVPICISISAIGLLVIFKGQRYILQFFQRKSNLQLAVEDFGYFFIVFFFFSYLLVITTIYFSVFIIPLKNSCGFSFINQSNTNETIIEVFRNLGTSYTSFSSDSMSAIGITNVFTVLYDHVFFNPLSLYVLGGLCFIFFLMRTEKIKALKYYISLITHRNKKESRVYESKINQKQNEIEVIEKKIEILQKLIKKKK